MRFVYGPMNENNTRTKCRMPSGLWFLMVIMLTSPLMLAASLLIFDGDFKSKLLTHSDFA